MRASTTPRKEKRETLNIQTDHNVYILGAGFSAEANMPTMVSFLARMRDSYEWLLERNRIKEAKAVQDVLNFRRDAASAAYWIRMDLDNVEELFSLASTTSKALSNSIRSAIASTLDYSAKIRTPLKIHYRYDSMPWAKTAKWLAPHKCNDEPNHYLAHPYSHHVAKLLGMYLDGKPKGKNTFITFNYDTVMEEALTDLGIGYSYCLDERRVNRSERASSLKADAASVRLLKLHGSVNWGRDKNAESGSRRRSMTEFNSYQEVYDGGKIPELIAPTWRKVFGSHLSSVWDASIDALAGATRVVVIGFSIPPTDSHIKYLLAGGLQENISLKRFAFCDWKIDQVKARATGLFQPLNFERDYADFVALKLGELTVSGEALSTIGRPLWTPSSGGTHQYCGEVPI